MFLIWVDIAMVFISLGIDSNELFSDRVDNSRFVPLLILLLVLVGVGWIFTAVVFAISLFLFAAKKLRYDDKSTSNSGE